MYHIQTATKKIAFLAMMLAMITVLSMLEHMLPPLPFLPPNVRLGLSNIITMYALFFLGKGSAFLLAVLKSVFILLTRGLTAGFLSFSGGILALLCIILLSAVFRHHVSYLALSVCGAIAHNTGQMLAASIITNTNLLLFYLPVMIFFGVVMGCVTGTLLKAVMPMFGHILKSAKSEKEDRL